MPIYEYEHVEETDCELGQQFEIRQSIKDDRLTVCPSCGKAVRRLISKTYINTPMTDSELKSKGFTKLVRRDKGIYENVTARDGEKRYMEADKPETLPNLKKTIKD